MKHENFTFFFWGFYPKKNHTRIASSNFFNRVLKGWIDNDIMDMEYLDQMIDNYYNHCLFNLHVNIDPDSKSSEFLNHSLVLICSSTGGFDDNDHLEYPQFHRDDCISIEIISQDPIGRPYWDERISGYLKILHLFCREFHPIFFFGHRDYNKWWDDSSVIQSPESRLWPLNIYNLSYYSKGFQNRLNGLVLEEDSGWEMKFIDSEIAQLCLKDLTIHEENIPMSDCVSNVRLEIPDKQII
jgi:hypothetical protein